MNTYRVQQDGANVVSLHFDDVASGWEQWVLLSSDRHHDNPYCNRGLEKEHLELAKERNAFIVDAGDLFCAMQGKYDPRSSMDDIRSEDVGQDYLDRIVKHAAEFYAPYAKHFLVMGDGNHEANIRKRHGMDLISNLIHRLNSEYGGTIHKGYYGGWVRFLFNVNQTRRVSKNLKYHHGAGGGGPVTKGVIQTNRQAVYLPDADIVLNGHCFDDKTEILTPSGWVGHEKLDKQSVVMTFNRDSGNLEWQQVNNVYRYDHYKELIALSARGLDLAVTPDHGLWTYTDGRDENNTRVKWDNPRAVWKPEKASEAYGKHRTIRLAGHEKDDEGIPLSIAQVRVLAWVMAEGNVAKTGKEQTVGAVRISQSDLPDGRIAMLEKDLAGAGLAYTKTARKMLRRWVPYRYWLVGAKKVWKEWMGEYLTPNKAPTEKLYAMNWKQRQAFVDAYVWADGSIDHRGHPSFQIAGNRKDQIDFLQSLLVRNGIRSSISYNNGMYYLAATPKETVYVGPENWSKIPYDGTVWCVSVPNGTLLVRRNGKACVTMNTHDGWVLPLARERLTQGGKVKKDLIWFARTPGYKDEYHDGSKGFHVEQWREPKPQGAVWLRFFYSQSSVEMELIPTIR